jgi:hypothetical protein
MTSPEDVIKILGQLSEEEIRQKAQELRDSKRAAGQHVQEVDNPNKGGGYTASPWQNDHVKRVNCPHCQFETMNYETVCVACGGKLDPTA